jgi:hypothetical protein
MVNNNVLAHIFLAVDKYLGVSPAEVRLAAE